MVNFKLRVSTRCSAEPITLCDGHFVTRFDQSETELIKKRPDTSISYGGSCTSCYHSKTLSFRQLSSVYSGILFQSPITENMVVIVSWQLAGNNTCKITASAETRTWTWTRTGFHALTGARETVSWAPSQISHLPFR